jgi:hypothetical protein
MAKLSGTPVRNSHPRKHVDIDSFVKFINNIYQNPNSAIYQSKCLS